LVAQGRFVDRLALITGAGRGIGLAIALRLAQEGARIIAVDINPDLAASTRLAVETLGRPCLDMVCDISNRQAIYTLVDQAQKKMGRIDILVNNAGVHQVRPILEISEADIDFMFGVNVKGVFFCTQAVASAMIKAGQGKIINMASHAGKRGGPNSAHYGASKAAVISLTRSWALALAPHHINVNAVCPGTVDTDMWAKIDEDTAVMMGLPKGEVLRQTVERIPLGRVETPDDVAGLVAFLASADADYMTGQAINITGGVTMH
jgi:meso-butanediol dehydrogenase / (S,S)-butanediol dehydrogenase / diacetyl reductase